MLDTSKFTWLKGDYDFESISKEESNVRAFLNHIHKKSWDMGKKNAVFAYYFSLVSEGKAPQFKNDKELSKFAKDMVKSEGYIQAAKESTKSDKRSFLIIGIIMALAFTAALHCLGAVIKGQNFMETYLEIVFGVVGIVITAVIYRLRLNMVGQYTDETNVFLVHDAIFVGISVLCKLLINTNFDMTIVLMALDVYFTTQELNDIIDKVIL